MPVANVYLTEAEKSALEKIGEKRGSNLGGTIRYVIKCFLETHSSKCCTHNNDKGN